MDIITFVTTNQGKVIEAQKQCDSAGIKLVTYNYELIEPRSEDLEEIAKAKVMQAYEKVGHPCIAMDSGFYIEALNGFPKTFVNFALSTIGINGILKLMEGVSNRRAYFKQCLAYYDGKEIKYFYSQHEGEIATEISGDDRIQKWSDLWYIFISNGYDKTLAALSDEEQKKRENKSEGTLAQFAKWYKRAVKSE